MEPKGIGVVTTTINEPTFLEGYIENAREHGYPPDDLTLLVVGDLKTPLDVERYCRSLASDHGVEVVYMGVDDQREWLESRGLDALREYLPYNSIQRRNIGYLRACEDGADVIVSLDDDNLAGDSDIFGAFSRVGERTDVLEVTSSNGWYNSASMLNYEQEASEDIYHRGFPYSKRSDGVDYEFAEKTREIAVRAGLWLDVPDVDVITHLERSPRAVSSARSSSTRPSRWGETRTVRSTPRIRRSTRR